MFSSRYPPARYRAATPLLGTEPEKGKAAPGHQARRRGAPRLTDVALHGDLLHPALQPPALGGSRHEGTAPGRGGGIEGEALCEGAARAQQPREPPTAATEITVAPSAAALAPAF